MTTTRTTVAPAGGDAIGAAVQACHRAGSYAGIAHAVLERDDGMLTVNDAAVYLSEDTTWSEVERRAPLAATGMVLDLGCGAGRHARALMRRGLDVRGVDNSPGMVAVAHSLGVDVELADLGALPAELGTFDTFLLLGGNLGLLGSRAAGRHILSSLTRLARSGARIIGTGINPYRLTHAAHQRYGEGNVAAGRMFGQYRMRARFEDVSSDWFDLLLLSPQELGGLAEGTGWTLCDLDEDDAFPMYTATLRLG
ncbi:class I SAM-dependent methyltransferase [Micromonospora sp. NPDC048830]|uniref:class I SAM-dependent methyltransferase n=1 Tax=Micromonospora sp. NPDC048830 TaxID=3364257 RepID=UPI0037134C97